MVKCDYCKYSTEDLSNFRRHFKSVHARAKIYCQHCEEKFSRKDNLNRHTLRKHKDKIQNIMEISIGFDIRLKKTSNCLYLDHRDVERLCLYQNL